MSFSRPDVEDWLRTKVSVEVPNFEGAFACTIQVTELEGFVCVLKEIKNSIGSENDFSWSNMEENIEFTFNVQRIGAIKGAYRFSSENFSLGPTLSGDFEADQSYIDDWLKQAELALLNAS